MEGLRDDAVADLLEEAGPYLPLEVASRRLDGLRNAEILEQPELVERILTTTGLKPEEDTAGGVIMPTGEDKLGKVALLENNPDPIIAYHNTVHEGVHLLGPDSVGGIDFIGRKFFRKSLGPVWSTHYLDDDGKILFSENILPEEKIFWEAVSDYVAAQKTAKKFGKDVVDQKLPEAGAGFTQRYWIELLVNKHPNPQEVEKTMREALYQGNMTEFLRVLGGRLDNPHVPFYHTLSHYMLEGEKALNNKQFPEYHAALDKWMRAIETHFANGGAYSLDMRYFQ